MIDRLALRVVERNHAPVCERRPAVHVARAEDVFRNRQLRYNAKRVQELDGMNRRERSFVECDLVPVGE
ncbi:hypothetical protein, partial [Mesorhizobium sp. M7A.F.Ca.CA.001.05.1.1]|uniref:hypothetical protein n=1 Tax=Mesorhizobium sp. M7A.F.Ca.CA.001.05.1.1 TaxID=2496721 RepID=UPI0019D04D9A